jgi:PhnB protein
MKATNFPDDHQQVMSYLVIKDAEGFIKFMKEVFDAKEKMIFKSDGRTIAHAELTIGKSVIMFSSDVVQLSPATISAFVYVSDSDKVHKKAMDAGATSVMDIKESPHGKSGGFIDPFGNTWWIKAYREKE